MSGRHLHEDRLYEYYLAGRDGEALDPPVAEHLLECPACSARYDDLSSLLTAVSTEGARESDAQFTPERLRAQQEHITRAIEHVGHSARVIGFPGRVTRHIARASARVAPPWLAAAAAAGLFVGVAVGAMFRESAGPSAVAASVAAPPTGARLAPQPAMLSAPAPAVSEAIDDERFLMELELALEHQNTRELQPFDALMPRAREISSQAR